MAASYILLSDLRARRCTNTSEVRLLRFWEARNINRNGELMSVDMLLIDENSTLVQGSIAAVRQLRFRQCLIEGSVYTLSGFDVVRSNPKYRLSDAPLSIRFNDGTAFEKLTTTVQIREEGKEHKESIVNGVREAVRKYNYVYVFSFENMRNIKFKEFKQLFRNKMFSLRFFFGLNKVMKVGLGRSASDEIRPAIFKASKVVYAASYNN